MKNNFVKIVGYIITFISFYYIYLSLKKLDVNWNNLLELINGVNVVLVITSFFIYLVVILISAIFWSYLVHYFSTNEKKVNNKLIKVYALSNIGKYLPGNFMQLVGRNVLGNKLGYKHSAIAKASIFEIAYVLLTGLLLMFVIIIFNLSNITLQEHLLSPDQLKMLFILCIVLIIIVVLFFKIKLLDYIQKNAIISNLENSILLALGVFLMVYFLLGTANFLLFSMFVNYPSMNDFTNILFVFVVSWVVGFVMPGMPGGIGVREAVFIFLLSQKYDILVVTLVPILFRLINILGDVLFFALYSIKIKGPRS